MNTYLLDSETIFEIHAKSAHTGVFEEYVDMMEKEGVLEKYFHVENFNRMISELRTEFENLPHICDYSNLKSEIAKCMAAHMADNLVRHGYKGNIEELVQTISEEAKNNKEKCVCFFGRALKECAKLVDLKIQKTFREAMLWINQLLQDLYDSGKVEECARRKQEIEMLMLKAMADMEDLGVDVDYLELSPGNLKKKVDSIASELKMDKEFSFIPVDTYLDEVMDLPYYEKLLKEQREKHSSDLEEIHEIKTMTELLFKERVVINVLDELMHSNSSMDEFSATISKLLQEKRMLFCMDYYDTLLKVDGKLTAAKMGKFRKIFNAAGIQYTMGMRVGNTVYVSDTKKPTT